MIGRRKKGSAKYKVEEEGETKMERDGMEEVKND